MTFVVHLFGWEIWRLSFGQLEAEQEFISNTGGEFEIPFGFAGAIEYEGEDNSVRRNDRSRSNGTA